MRLQLTISCAAFLSLSGLACAPAKGPDAPRPNLVSVTVEQDLGIVSGSSVCGKSAQLNDGFACFRADKTQYHGTPKSQDGGDPEGVFQGTTRVLASYDRLLFNHWTIGARVGVVVNGAGPKPDGAAAPNFLPFHGELRTGYWFGAAPFVGTGFRAGVFVAGGIAQVDSTWQVTVVENTKVRPPANQPDNPAKQVLDAYQKAGTGFVGGGLSLAYAFLPMSAFVLHLKIMELFPSNGTALAPEFGYEHAF
ncbi:MAG: hypothetical protein U0441_20830 [Polyangiaceae bacterium]